MLMSSGFTPLWICRVMAAFSPELQAEQTTRKSQSKVHPRLAAPRFVRDSMHHCPGSLRGFGVRGLRLEGACAQADLRPPCSGSP
jgi:hypothetical protein